MNSARRIMKHEIYKPLILRLNLQDLKRRYENPDNYLLITTTPVDREEMLDTISYNLRWLKSELAKKIKEASLNFEATKTFLINQPMAIN